MTKPKGRGQAAIKPLPHQQATALAILALEHHAEVVRPADGRLNSETREFLGAAKTFREAQRAST